MVAITERLRVEIKTGLEEMKATILADQQEMKADQNKKANYRKLKGQNGRLIKKRQRPWWSHYKWAPCQKPCAFLPSCRALLLMFYMESLNQ
jgi:hypothetical protein